jgi:hypothetical protein
MTLRKLVLAVIVAQVLLALAAAGIWAALIVIEHATSHEQPRSGTTFQATAP